jgi:hypothetical protein
MDVMRSGTAQPYRYLTSGDDTILLRWYKVPDDTPVYPGVHAFGSSFWQGYEQEVFDGPGYVAGSPINWRPTRIIKPGNTGIPDGPLDWFAEGIPASHAHDRPPPCAVRPVQSSLGLDLEAVAALKLPFLADADLLLEATLGPPAGVVLADADLLLEATLGPPAGVVLADADLLLEATNGADTMPFNGAQLSGGVDSFTFNVPVTATFDNVLYDTNSYAALGSDSTIFTVPADGVYRVGFNVTLEREDADPFNAANVYLALEQNGSGVFFGDSRSIPDGQLDYVAVTIATDEEATAGDTFSASCQLDTASSDPVTATFFFWIQYMGPLP